MTIADTQTNLATASEYTNPDSALFTISKHKSGPSALWGGKIIMNKVGFLTKFFN